MECRAIGLNIVALHWREWRHGAGMEESCDGVSNRVNGRLSWKGGWGGGVLLKTSHGKMFGISLFKYQICRLLSPDGFVRITSHE